LTEETKTLLTKREASHRVENTVPIGNEPITYTGFQLRNFTFSKTVLEFLNERENIVT